MIYKVCIPHTYRDFFDYEGGTLTPCIGARVWVPFRNKERVGMVVDIGAPENPAIVLKSLIREIDTEPLFSAELLALCQWIARYYQSPLSEVLPLALPKKYQRGLHKQLPHSTVYSLTFPAERAHLQLPTRAVRQHQLLDFMAKLDTPLSIKALCQAGYSSAQLKGLLSCGVVQKQEQVLIPTAKDTKRSAPLALNPEQAQAVQTIAAHLQAYHCFLLHGVTGSGKTEVYLQVVAQVLAQGRQVLIVVPEIGLTPQLLARFSARFQAPMAVIHSHLNDTERQEAWQLASDRLVRLVIGTRSAIFTPMPDLGLIVIDEEHDASLKQMEGVRYSARDTALMRAHMANIPIVLGSATPSLESLHNCGLKKYTQLYLTQRALSQTPLHYQILDIRNQPLRHGLASATLTLIDEHLQQDNQVLVFINRRGFAPVLLCHQCGFMADCRACDSHLTLHRAANRLICHHCGLTQTILTQCRKCNSRELVPVGTGTQRIHEYLTEHFPTTSILRIDRDEVGAKHALDERLARIYAGDAQLIVGTQMLAKGHDFPRLTLVVVVDADHGFYNQDFRALERLGQLLTQVAGRAGRANFPGQVVIQTHVPQHPMLNRLIKEGYASFAQHLLASRQQAQLPPYYFLAVMRAQAKYLPKLLQFMHAVKEQLGTTDVSILGPAPAPLARKADYHRMQLLIKAASRQTLRTALSPMHAWLTTHKMSSGVRWNLDIDPMDLS